MSASKKPQNYTKQRLFETCIKYFTEIFNEDNLLGQLAFERWQAVRTTIKLLGLYEEYQNYKNDTFDG